MTLALTFIGKNNFGSLKKIIRAYHQVKPFEKMIEIASEAMNKFKPIIESRSSTYEYDILGGDHASLLMGGVVRIDGKINQVPGMASFTIDRRVLPEENLDEAWKELSSFFTGRGASVREINRMAPCLTSSDSLIVKMMSAAAEKEFASAPSPKVCTAGLDMGYYVSRGFECVTYGPGEIRLAHAADEFILLKDIYSFSRVYARAAMTLFSSFANSKHSQVGKTLK